MPADDSAIEQQHRHVESETARELRISIDVQHVHRRQTMLLPERAKLLEHLVAQRTILSMNDIEWRTSDALSAMGKAQRRGGAAKRPACCGLIDLR